jgi:hypothetical protein
VASSCVSSSGNSAEEDGGADSGEGEKTGSAGLLRTLTATLDRSYEFHRVASPSPGARRSQSAPKHCAPSNFREDREEEEGSAGLLRKLTETLDRSYEFRRAASPSPGARRSQSAISHHAPGDSPCAS